MRGNFKKVALAYSGGLDTSIIIPWLKENYNCEIVAVCGNVGQGDDAEAIKAKAIKSGASKCYVGDLSAEFVKDYIFPTVKAGAVYEKKYLLGTSMARPLIAKYLVEIAKQEKCDAICHGCTGKGNDQVRFELTIKALAPELPIIAPWREWDITSREEEIDYAEAHGIPVPMTRKTSYSRDKNIWHLSHEGLDLENPWNEYQKDLLQICVHPEDAPDQPQYVEIEFAKGEPVAVDGVKCDPVALLTKLNELGAAHGVGIASLVENRLVGMKSRGVYETPGGTILMEAHQALESITVDRETSHYKELIASRYAELVYYGQWFLPLRRALDAFVNVTQEYVSGKVRVKLYKGSCGAVGISSPHSLYNEELATFSKDEIYKQSDAEGFINLFGLPIKVLALAKRIDADQ
ncbi:MAG: argininosuccinate synthase [Clostridia bacterium]|nr:argininosuccinate synthase [Clostridia bacterium]